MSTAVYIIMVLAVLNLEGAYFTKRMSNPMTKSLKFTDKNSSSETGIM